MRMLTIHTRHFPPGDYRAITLFPVVVYKGAPLTERERQHERVHLWQQLALLIVLFYVLYFLFWLVALLRFRNWMRAYRSIPFERSAYRLESHTAPRPMAMAFDWLHCLK